MVQTDPALSGRLIRRPTTASYIARPVVLTISIGVATREPGTIDIDVLVSTADQALYAAKDAGRNQTCTCQRIVP